MVIACYDSFEDYAFASRTDPADKMSGIKLEEASSEDGMKREPSEEPSSANSEGSTDDDILKKGAWTAEEDAQLSKLVQVCHPSIAKFIQHTQNFLYFAVRHGEGSIKEYKKAFIAFLGKIDARMKGHT